MTFEVRRATLDDEAAVAGFTRDTWPDRREDYLPEVFAEWVESDDETQRTFVAEADGTAIGVVRAVLLSDWEAWMHGLRVAPSARGQGVSRHLHRATVDWARERGASVARIMVFSWNGPALTAARALGYEPLTELRWVHPEPTADATAELSVTADPESAWRFWETSDACDRLEGLVLAPEMPWALRALTPKDLDRAATETALQVVNDGPARGFAFRIRTSDREHSDGHDERWAEYGVAAWADGTACASLLAAIARDAAAVAADRTRVAVPETVGAVSDAAAAGVEIADEPVFVLEVALDRSP